ncbi:YcxB family protein [Flavobacterium sp. MAH-1]|uniref:YcxB family protein n=1 Tax=Flavobacterium agri TaxID=2743471 RepID=A0A7Y8XZM5_9FLAO|nr:YcxB family protein [Flavobacterium agri]NUY79641.1 YcxB family protein [Flavobacterium agri]NYA69666.1 YcxB family protein [Flavobacterium agri]
MKFTYSCSIDDYLQYQLYTASTSPTIKKQRLKSLLIFSIVLIAASYFFNEFRSFFEVAVITALNLGLITLYAVYLRNHYRQHYRKFIKDNYKNKAEKISSVTFREHYIETIDETGESKINYTNLEEVNEIREYIFLKLKTGESLIFPKSEIQDIDGLRGKLAELSDEYNLKSNVDLNWKW